MPLIVILGRSRCVVSHPERQVRQVLHTTKRCSQVPGSCWRLVQIDRPLLYSKYSQAESLKLLMECYSKSFYLFLYSVTHFLFQHIYFYNVYPILDTLPLYKSNISELGMKYGCFFVLK